MNNITPGSHNFNANQFALIGISAYRILGSNVVCCSGTNFTLVNPGNLNVTWTVTGPFTPAVSTGTSITISRTGVGAGSGVLRAFINNTEVASMNITACMPAMSGPNFICANAPSTFTVTGVSNNVSVAWTTSPGLTINGSSTGNTVQVRGVSSWETRLNEWVRVTVTHAGSTIFTRQIPVTVWASGIQREEVRNATLSGHMVSWGGEFRVTTPDGWMMMPGSDFRWSTDAWGFEFWQGHPLTLLQSSWGNQLCGRYYVTVDFADVCGGRSILFQSFDVFDCGGWWFFAYPNPARDVLTVRLNDEQMEMQADGQRASLGNVELMLYNHDGQLVRRQAMGVMVRQATINTSDLPAGNYVLNIVVDGQVVERQVIVVVN